MTSMKKCLLDEEIEPYQEQPLGLIEEEFTEHSSLLQPPYISYQEISYFQELPREKVQTNKGDITLAIQGERTKCRTTMMTLLDIGQNHVTAFQSFFCFHQVRRVLKHFTVYHVNFPGQEENAEDLPDHYKYPSMDEMADVLSEVADQLGITKAVCLGTGAGANVLTRLALKRPQLVECLILINGSYEQASWADWCQLKTVSRSLKSKRIDNAVLDYLMNYYFGTNQHKSHSELVERVRKQLLHLQSPKNLGLFIEAYSKRDALKIDRPSMESLGVHEPSDISQSCLKCPTLIISGDSSNKLNESVRLNSKLDPSRSTFVEIPESSGLVLEEQQWKVANALILFLQGYGYVKKLKAPMMQ